MTAVETNGFAVVEEVVPAKLVEHLKAGITELRDREEVRRRGGTFGIRNLLEISEITRQLAVCPELHEMVEPVLGPGAFAVRATLFDKIPGANWNLFWHQDSVITVREPIGVEGFGGFSKKAGIWHVQPTTDVLDRMLAVRVHLDDCGEDNGPLRVLPGSHQGGWLDDDLQRWKQDVPPITCTVGAGGVVLMRPLLLHASSAAESPNHRRVIHLEYANDPLPGGLSWHTQLR